MNTKGADLLDTAINKPSTAEKNPGEGERKSWSVLVQEMLKSAGLRGLMDPDDRRALRTRLENELRNAYMAGLEQQDRLKRQEAKKRTKRMTEMRELKARRGWEVKEFQNPDSDPFLGVELESAVAEVVINEKRADGKLRRKLKTLLTTIGVCIDEANEVIVDNELPDMKTWVEAYVTEPPDVKMPLLPIVKLEMSVNADMVNIVLEWNGDVVGKLLASRADVLCAISERFSDRVDYFCKTAIRELNSMEITPWMLRREIAVTIKEKEEWLRKSFQD